LPDFLQDGMHIAGKFGFRNANGVHVTDHSLLFSASLSSSDSVKDLLKRPLFVLVRARSVESLHKGTNSFPIKRLIPTSRESSGGGDQSLKCILPHPVGLDWIVVRLVRRKAGSQMAHVRSKALV